MGKGEEERESEVMLFLPAQVPVNITILKPLSVLWKLLLVSKGMGMGLGEVLATPFPFVSSHRGQDKSIYILPSLVI